MFCNQLISDLNNLFEDSSFSDVTLVSNDQKVFKAHKLILSACSPVLKSVLLTSSDTQPVIHLAGMDQDMVESIMQLLYTGKTRHDTEEEEFIKAAKDLGIEELVSLVSEAESSRKESFKVEATSNLYFCEECEKGFRTRSGLVLHMTNKHENISYNCDVCEYRATQHSSLKRHQQSKHEKVKHSCSQCGYKASQKCSLRKHEQSIHEGVRYSCEQCDYLATRPDHLRSHKKSKHDGVRYSCSQCKYKATSQSSLKIHEQCIHEGVRFSCSHCGYLTGVKSRLKLHNRVKHPKAF